MSSPPPTQPPWTAAITGKRACSRRLNASCSQSAFCRIPSRARAVSVPSAPLVKTDRSIPAVKWRPVEASTSARVFPAASSARTSWGSSFQNSIVIELSASGRESVSSATPSCSFRVKQVGLSIRPA